MHKVEKQFFETGKAQVFRNKLIPVTFSLAALGLGSWFLFVEGWGSLVLGGLTIFFGLVMCFFTFLSFKDKSPVLTLDPSGITNHEPHLYDFETIKWVDIKDVYIQKRKMNIFKQQKSVQHLVIKTHQGQTHLLYLGYITISNQVLRRIISQKIGLF